MRAQICNLMAVALLISTAVARAAEPAPDASQKEVALMNNAFASDLYARLAAKEGNLFFSPTSIQTALAMTWAGARGQTADEMARTLHFNDEPNDALRNVNEQLGTFVRRLNADGTKGGYELSVANALWGLKGYPFLPNYLELVKKYYDGNLSQLDFVHDAEGSRTIINAWVAGQTHDRIKDLLPAGVIKPSTRLVLTNAIYFKGSWDQPFEKRRTQDGDFTLSDGNKVKASFMHQRARFRYAQDDDVQLLEMTYGKNDLAMRVLLPKKTDGLTAFEKGMTAGRVDRLVDGLQQQDVVVSVPRCTMESEFSLADTLEAMGMKLAFDPNRADFTGMTSAEPLYISAVIHKAFVKIDEQGTEAAAATGIAMRAGAVRMEPPPIEFTADHPFVFEIVQQSSGAVLFMGRVETP